MGRGSLGDPWAFLGHPFGVSLDLVRGVSGVSLEEGGGGRIPGRSWGSPSHSLEGLEEEELAEGFCWASSRFQTLLRLSFIPRELGRRRRQRRGCRAGAARTAAGTGGRACPACRHRRRGHPPVRPLHPRDVWPVPCQAPALVPFLPPRVCPLPSHGGRHLPRDRVCPLPSWPPHRSSLLPPTRTKMLIPCGPQNSPRTPGTRVARCHPAVLHPSRCPCPGWDPLSPLRPRERAQIRAFWPLRCS